MKKSTSLVGVFIFAMILFLGSSVDTIPFLNAPGAMDPFLNGQLPRNTPGSEGMWRLEDNFSDISISSPITINEWPLDESLMVLSKTGEIWKISEAGDSQSLLLDITDRTFFLSDAGALGMALHPDFGNASHPDDQLIFVYYKTKPDAAIWDERGFSRLSKFQWDDSNNEFDADTEEILIQQYDRSPWHNGGSLLFGSDGFLYFGAGDEGALEMQVASTQRLDGGFFNGLFRIDVDNDLSRSHPIRRQPIANDTSPSGWGATYSQGYSIPNDNPWLDADGSILEEYYAIGLRSPFAMQEDDNEIWIVDAGSDQREEINIVLKGDNLQWPYVEGTLTSEVRDKPIALIGKDKTPFFEYDRSIGTCAVGGALYQSSKFPELFDHYIFGDYTTNKIASIHSDNLNPDPILQVLISNISEQPIDLPENPGVTSVFHSSDGRVLITVIGEDHEKPGKILELASDSETTDPVALLSQLDLFDDLVNLNPIEGIIPYSVNAPLWSDGAGKRRWVAIPNDGIFDEPEEQIIFNPLGSWTFPIGTVFIKHFEIADPDDSSNIIPVETRFFVIGEDRRPYGLTYAWNDEGTDAELLKVSETKNLEISPDLPTQSWSYPSRAQCISCHNQNAGSILGFKTAQLNKSQDYAFGSMNQIEYYKEINLFRNPVSSVSSYPKLSNMNAADIRLESRIRSYLDANCSNCHRDGGVATLNMDLRYNQTSDLSRYIDRKTNSHASTVDKLITPGDHATSELWIRDASSDANKMPPIGRNMVDQIYVDSLAKWIDNLEIDETRFHDILIYPNPAADWINIHAHADWEPPFVYTLYSIDGRRMRYIRSDSNFQTMDVGQYPRGVYVLSIESGGKRLVKKLRFE